MNSPKHLASHAVWLESPRSSRCPAPSGHAGDSSHIAAPSHGDVAAVVHGRHSRGGSPWGAPWGPQTGGGGVGTDGGGGVADGTS